MSVLASCRGVLCVWLVCAAWLTLPAAERTKTVDAGRFVRAMNSGAIIIDARPHEAFASGHIMGALSAQVTDFRQRLPNDQRAALVVYGAGPQAEHAADVMTQLREWGYRNISHFAGGIQEWRQRGLQLMPGAQPSPEGLHYHDGIAYLIKPVELPAGQLPSMLIWCHPGSGDPAEGFAFLQQSSLFDGQDDNTILVAPQAADTNWMIQRDGPAVERLIAHLLEVHSVDPSRVVLGGHSSGGFFTYDWGLQHQATFAALVPAAAFATRPVPPADRRSAPVIDIYHSRNDRVASWQQMERTRNQADAAGYTTTLEEDTLGHSIGPALLRLIERRFAALAAP